MRSAELCLSDPRNDNTNARKSMLYRNLDAGQNAMIRASGSSGSRSTADPRSWNTTCSLDDGDRDDHDDYDNDDDDDDDDIDDIDGDNVEYNEDDEDKDEDAEGAAAAAAAVGGASAENTRERVHGSLPSVSDPLDSDMSDSDGGVSLGHGPLGVDDLFFDEREHDSDETYQMDESYGQAKDDSERGDNAADDDDDDDDQEVAADEMQQGEGEAEEGELQNIDPLQPTNFDTLHVLPPHGWFASSLDMPGDVMSDGLPSTFGPSLPASPSMTAFMAALVEGMPEVPASLMNPDPSPPISLTNPGLSIIGSENLGLMDFLRSWAYGQVLFPNMRVPRPSLHEVLRQAGDEVEHVGYGDLRGDACDFQGLNWESMGTTRETARERRSCTYKNYVNKLGSDLLSHLSGEEIIPITDNFFRFQRMHIRRDVALAHFQLRSVLACPSRTQAFYPSLHGINVLNTASRRAELALDLHDFPGTSMAVISTLDAGCGVLLGGTFNGNYCLKSLDSEDSKSFSEGQISTEISGITNHIRIYRPRRSHSPVAAIASNDHGLRVMDLQTEKMLFTKTYPFALNCSAVSPDGRLRALVGDNLDVFITNADTGETLQKLSGHRDYGFSCDWSDDGWTVATGFQDRGIRIWDARRWCTSSGVSQPVCTLRAEMAGVRGLRFSPLGSGRPVLVAAEEADFVNMIDATTFASKQTIDVFGEIGGVAFTNEGRDLSVLCCDGQRGGVLQLERCGDPGRTFAERGRDREMERVEQMEQEAYIMRSWRDWHSYSDNSYAHDYARDGYAYDSMAYFSNFSPPPSSSSSSSHHHQNYRLGHQENYYGDYSHRGSAMQGHGRYRVSGFWGDLEPF